MDFAYSKEQKMFEDAVKEFTKREIIPVCLDFEDDPDGKLAHSVITKTAKAEILGLVVPDLSHSCGSWFLRRRRVRQPRSFRVLIQRIVSGSNL